MNYGLVHSSYSSFFFVWKCFIIIDMTKKIFGSIEQLINVIALIVSGAYITHFMLSYSAIPVRLTSVQLSQVLFILYVLDAFKIVKAFIKKDITALVMFVTSFVVTFLSYQASGGEYQFLMFIPPIIFALYDIEYDKVISVYLVLIGIVLIVAIFSSQVNVISDYVYNGIDKVRSSMGICYPTDYATIVLFFMMLLWTKKKKCSDWFMLFPAVISLLNAIFIAGSRTSMMCSILLIVGIIIYNVFDCLKDRFNFKSIKKIINILFICVVPICALFTLVISILYASGLPFAQTINTWMSNRLELTVSGARNYGIHPFGSFFELKGGGGGGADFTNGYNFLDNSYALIFIRYGWIYFVLILSLWLITMKRVLKEDKYKLAIVMSIIAVHSISEHHYIDASFNLLLFMPFVNFKDGKAVENDNKIAENISLIITGVVFIPLLICILPSFLSYFRTFVTVNNIENVNSKIGAIVFPLLMLFATLFFFFVYAVKQLLFCVLSNKKINAIYVYVVCFTLFISCIIPQYKNMIYASSYDSYLELFQEEEEIVQLIKDNKSGKLYAADVPEYYNKYFKGFSTNILQGEELAREKNCTVITKLNFDSDVFPYAGFKWMQISDSHAIYTNDESVISTLENNGYQLSTVYSKENKVDVLHMGAVNGIQPNEYGQILIQINHSSISTSQNIYLHAHTYSITVNISDLSSISGQEITADQPIANFQVKYTDTDEVMFEGQIYPQFDENGYYDCEFIVNSWRVANVYLTLEPMNDSCFWLNEIRYKKA